VPTPPRAPAAHVQAALARTASIQPKLGGSSRATAPSFAPHVQAALAATAQAKPLPGLGAAPVQAAHIRAAVLKVGPLTGAAQPQRPARFHSGAPERPGPVIGARPAAVAVAQPKGNGLPGAAVPRLAAPVLRPAPPPNCGVVQRADDKKEEKKRDIPEDVLPFVSEEYRSGIKDVDITKKHKGVFVYQVTKTRNLPSIRALGLLANFGGSRVGLSQNPSQRESLLIRSMAHSRGRVTVGTSSVVIDNYKKKAVEWYRFIMEGLEILSRSDDVSQIVLARRKLVTMPWIDSPRLLRLFNFPLEEWTGSEDGRLRRTAGLLREVFARLLSVCWLNEPVILRFRSNLASWEVDPDDPAGYQSRESIGETHIEALIDDAWVPIQNDALDPLMRSISMACLIENGLLDLSAIRNQRRERARRARMGIEGVENPRETPAETAAMMGL
jgi:hypothetical protein